jgi:hypothetical protein
MRRLVNRDYDRPNTLILPLILALPLVGFLALKPVPQALQQKSIPPVETAAQEDMHIAAMMPPVLTENGPRSMGIPADTIKTRKEKKSVRKHQEKSDIDTLEEAFDWDAEFDMDFDFEFPEIEFTDSLDLHFQFMGAHLDEAFNHLEFDFPHVHMHDSFSTIWKDVRIDIEEAFKDLEHEFPRMDFTDTNWIDKEELRKNMDALRKEMKKFRSDEFQEEMKKARLEMQRSMDQLREEMKRFKEEEWPKIREEIRKTIEEDQKHKSTRTDSLKIRTTGAHAI